MATLTDTQYELEKIKKELSEEQSKTNKATADLAARDSELDRERKGRAAAESRLKALEDEELTGEKDAIEALKSEVRDGRPTIKI